jgi:hypothetical protein
MEPEFLGGEADSESISENTKQAWSSLCRKQTAGAQKGTGHVKRTWTQAVRGSSLSKSGAMEAPQQIMKIRDHNTPRQVEINDRTTMSTDK